VKQSKAEDTQGTRYKGKKERQNSAREYLTAQFEIDVISGNI
jgi:hypothetical protein